MTDYDGSDSEYWVNIGRKRMKEEMTEKIDEYCKMKCPSSYDLFKLFADITGFKIERFHDALKQKSEAAE